MRDARPSMRGGANFCADNVYFGAPNAHFCALDANSCTPNVYLPSDCNPCIFSDGRPK
jgi:hypothetical protein